MIQARELACANTAPPAPHEALDAVLVARAHVRTPFTRRDDDDFEVVASVEQVQAGSPLDAILRREQTLALLELLRAAERAA